MTPRIFGPKQLNILDNPSVYVSDIVYDEVDFYRSGHAIMSGPFSLAVDFQNTTKRIVFIGIIIETTEGIVSVSDRFNLAFCPSLSSITISAASVPSLAYIRGDIKKITLRIYRLINQTDLDLDTRFITYIRLDDPLPIVSPTSLIGRDTQAEQPGAFFSQQSASPEYFETVLPANTPVTPTVILRTTFNLTAAYAVFRLRLISCMISVAPTPYPGDCIVQVNIDTSLDISLGLTRGMVALIRSATDVYVCEKIPLNITILASERVSIVGYNINTSRAGAANASLLCELVY